MDLSLKIKYTYPAGEAVEQHQRGDWPLCLDPSLQQTLHTWWYLCTAKLMIHFTCNSHSTWSPTEERPSSHMEFSNMQTLCWKTYIPWCLAVTYPSVFFQCEENFIFTSILSCGLEIKATGVSITSHTSTSLIFHFVVFILLTEKASFSTKCAIPLGYFASCLDPEFTKTKERERKYPQ